MPGMSYTETIGFMDMVLASLEKLRNVLRKGGVDADPLIEIVRGLRDRAIDLNAKQEAHKRGSSPRPRSSRRSSTRRTIARAGPSTR